MSVVCKKWLAKQALIYLSSWTELLHNKKMHYMKNWSEMKEEEKMTRNISISMVLTGILKII